MAPQYRSEFPTSGAGTSPRQAVWSTPPSLNDLILLETCTEHDVIPTVPEGFYPIGVAVATGVIHTRVYWKLATASEPSSYDVSFSGGGQGNIGMLSLYPEVEPYVTFQGVAKTLSTTSSGNRVFPTVTTQVDNCVVLCFGGWQDQLTTPLAGFTERWDVAGTDCHIYLMTGVKVTAGSTGSKTATGTAITTRRMITIAIRETPAKPSIIPFLHYFDDDLGLIDAGYGHGIARQYTISGVEGEGVQEAGGGLYIDAPVDTIRLLIAGIAKFRRNKESAFDSADGNMTLQKDGSISRTEDFTFSVPSYGVNFEQSFQMELTYVLSGEWPENNQEYFTNPPVSDTGNGASIYVNASAFGSNIPDATASFSLRIAEIELRDGTVIAPPTEAVISVVTINQVSILITWVNNSFDSEGIVIERSPNGTTGWTEIDTVPVDDLSYTDTDLDPETTYYYRLRYFLSEDYSNVDSDTTLDFNLIAETISQIQIHLEWDLISGDTSDQILQRSLDGISGWTNVATVGSGFNEYDNEGLDSSTTYYYRIYNEDGDFYTNVASATTTDFILATVALGSDVIQLSWTNLSFDSLGYSIERSPDGLDWTEIDTTGEDVDFYYDAGLSPITTYYYRILDVYSGIYSNINSATTSQIEDYRIGIGHDLDLADMQKLVPQPHVSGIKITRRSHGHANKIKDDFLYTDLLFNILGGINGFRAVLDQLGLLDDIEVDITITLKNNSLEWGKYNAIAVRPQQGEDVEWSNFFPRNIVILIKEIEQ